LELPIADVYGFWRRLENLPRFMAHLDAVTEDADAGRSHWVAAGPAGLRVEWDAEIINEVENQTLGWRSLPGSDVVTAGSVQYGGWLDKFPLGAAFAKGLTLKMGQTHVHKYLPGLLARVERGEIDPSFIITHRVGLDDAPTMYRSFRDKQDRCIRVVMRPTDPPSRAHRDTVA